ncbi:ATP-binding protein [Brevundimonas sp. NIBR10]|uniref:ATP-binding protein n=1 Tax=Brevundimonas sp. NIBR10 TaxID=3015997 RepID=UPI0022F175EE|nr:ATP-binding protein [Brevundimonas sp. NIBR10]
MKRPASISVMVQVALLVAVAVILSQAVAFAVVVLAPEPRPQGFSMEAAASALKGEAAETTDGKTLKRRLADHPASSRSADRPNDPLTLALETTLARRLGTTPDRVRVETTQGPGWSRRDGAGRVLFDHRPADRPGGREPFGPGGVIVMTRPPKPQDFVETQSTTRIVGLSAGQGPAQPEAGRTPDPVAGAVSNIVVSRTETRTGPSRIQVDQLAVFDRLSFPPFTASFQQPDGRWAIVEPPHDLLSPSQMRLLLSMGISMLLLAPLVWFMARRLTRPIRVFAEAAERLGADPDAEPLKPSGPREVRTAITAFNDMQAKLRDHIRRRTQTVAAIAHDLRTPLTRLRFRAEQAPEALRDRMAADVEEMDALIGQAMAYVRGEAAPDRREPLDLTTLTADCAAGFSDTGEPVGFTEGPTLAVQGDPAGLRRALANLIGNAVKYGGVARVTTLTQDGRAVVLVEDDGPGLPADDLETVFEPFARAERSRNRETGGAGLGLTVARQVARAHGGDVVLIPRPEGGLIARLTLPLA